MESLSRTEGNKLIVKFMGFEIKDGFVLNFRAHSKLDPVFLHYNSSWDWLMPVVEKISKLNHVSLHLVPTQIGKNEGYCHIEYGIVGVEKIIVNHGVFIDSTWLSVVNFIKWYNKKNQNG